MAQVMEIKPPDIHSVQPIKNELESLYDQFSSGMLACAIAIVGCRDRAEDAIHEAFCRLLKIQDRPRDLKAFAFRSVRNAAIDIVRRDKRILELREDIFIDGSVGPRQAAEAVELRSRMAAALNTLPPDERETIIQHIYGELTFQEISELRAVPIGTVTTWYRRGLDRLRLTVKER